MFGMTKKQFLKKSKKCLKDTGIELLIIREIINQETRGRGELDESYKKMENIRKNLEKIFFQYEKLNPPSKCKKMHFNLLNAIIILQESVVANTEYLNLLKDGLKEPAHDKLEKSIDKLEKFREKYYEIIREVDLNLKPR